MKNKDYYIREIENSLYELPIEIEQTDLSTIVSSIYNLIEESYNDGYADGLEDSDFYLGWDAVGWEEE